jgi:hypothetical protein
MVFDVPNIAFYSAIAFFYIRLVYIQWRKARGAAKNTNLEIARARKKGRSPKLPEKPATERFSIQVVNWYLVVGTIILVILGWAWKGNPFQLSVEIVSLWWIPVDIGIVGLSFLIK